MGRQRTPTPVLRITGSNRATAREKKEPKPDPGIPECPAKLDAEGRRAWASLAPLLVRMQCLTEADGVALAILCELWSRYVEVTLDLHKHGPTYRITDKKRGTTMVKRNPASTIQLELAQQLRRALGEFGLTPAARSRVLLELPGLGSPHGTTPTLFSRRAAMGA